MNLAHKYDNARHTHYAHCGIVKAQDVKEDGAFTGYAAVFGNVDQGGDMILKGAFADTIKERAGKIRVLWNHSSADPIGSPTHLSEDDNGLFVRGQLNQEVQRGREARALMKAGDVEGMSIGFRVAKNGAEFDEDTGVFKISKIILREFSIVTFPMNELAVATGIKSELSGIQTVRDFEEFLLDTTNFTKAQACSIASHGFKAGIRSDSDPAGENGNGGDPRLDVSKALQAIKHFQAPVFKRATII